MRLVTDLEKYACSRAIGLRSRIGARGDELGDMEAAAIGKRIALGGPVPIDWTYTRTANPSFLSRLQKLTLAGFEVTDVARAAGRLELVDFIQNAT